MKNRTISSLYSVLLGLSYITATPLHAAEPAAKSYANRISDAAYCVTYACKTLLKNTPDTYVKPFEMPQELPSMQEIAQRIKAKPESRVPFFLTGASTSEHQCSKICQEMREQKGEPVCSWDEYAIKHNLPQPTDKDYHMDWWKHYKSYIDHAKQHNLNAIRFSIEWAVVQPSGPESFNREALDHYAELFAYMIKQEIQPIVCFHHYTDPCWYLNMGGFEKIENIDYFVNFCNTTYTHIMNHIGQNKQARAAFKKMLPRYPLWLSFNAPDGYAFRGYRQNAGPPSIKARSGLRVVSEVLKNTLESHVRMYYAMKKSYQTLNEQFNFETDGHNAPQIGILKNIHQTDPAQNTWTQYALSPLTRALLTFADQIQNGSFYKFFTEGEFRTHIPFVFNMSHSNEKAKTALDFVGINHYSNRYMQLTKKVDQPNPDLNTDGDTYYHYPYGIYRAIVAIGNNLAKPLGIPMYVAENGIATQDDAKRARFYHEYLYAIMLAAEDGYPVFGYTPWTFFSNYEWPSLENNKQRDYGIFAVDANDSSKLIPKEGSLGLLSFYKTMKDLA